MVEDSEMATQAEFWRNLSAANKATAAGNLTAAADFLWKTRDDPTTGDPELDARRRSVADRLSQAFLQPALDATETARESRVAAPRGWETLAAVSIPGHSSPQSGPRPPVAAAINLHALPQPKWSHDLSEMIVDPAQEAPVLEHITPADSVSVSVNSEALALPFRQAPENLDTRSVLKTLMRDREPVVGLRQAESLLAFERFLDSIDRTIGHDGFFASVTLLRGQWFHMALREDPSNPFNLLGAALSCLRTGDRTRGRHLLKRLAGSRYREARLAQHVLRTAISRACTQ